jgi:dihydrofolate reductase
VVTHRGQDPIGQGADNSDTFIAGGIEEAVRQARAVADSRDVLSAGGVSIAQQALDAGLADEVVLHVVPRLAGRGIPLFGTARTDLRYTEAIQREGALHLRYEIR